MTAKVLLVDTDLALLRQMRNGAELHDDVELLTAQNWDEASELLGLVEVRLVVGSISSAHGVGMAALRRLERRGQRVAALGPDVPAIIRASAEGGIHNYIHKPLSPTAFFTRIKTLLHDDSPTAALTGFALADLLQLLAASGQTMTLRVRNDDERGELVVARGALVHAAVADQRGLDAASTILGWSDAKVSSSPDAPEPAGWTCDVPLMRLLLDAARIRDERVRDQARERLTALVAQVANMPGVLAISLVHDASRTELLGEAQQSFDREFGLELLLDALSMGEGTEADRPSFVRMGFRRCEILGMRLGDSGVVHVVWMDLDESTSDPHAQLRIVNEELLENLPNALSMISLDVEQSVAAGM